MHEHIWSDKEVVVWVIRQQQEGELLVYQKKVPTCFCTDESCTAIKAGNEVFIKTEGTQNTYQEENHEG